MKHGKIEFTEAMHPAESAADPSFAVPPGHYDGLTDPATLLQAGLEDVLHARLRRAYQAFLRASLLLEQSNDVHMYCRALALLSYAAIALGHNDEAMESAFLSCRLLSGVGSPEQIAFARNYLGVTMMWNGNYDRAAEEFGEAIAGARASSSSFMTPFVNRCYTEILRQMSNRETLGQQPDVGALSALLGPTDLDSQAGDAGMVHTGSPKHLRFMLSCCDGMRAVWANDLPMARTRLGESWAIADGVDFQVWATPLLGWLAAEVALAESDLPAAVQATHAMVESAIELQHEKFASLGLNLMSFMLSRQGRNTEALDVLKRLSTREQAIRTESLVHRQRIADWQAKLYEQRNEATLWRASSMRYHELSMQDPLTGLANRRCLDEALQSHLGLNSTLQLHVITIDVDQFKSVNDNFSHLVGDKVLQAIGATLQEQLRQNDIAARIGGDEFMLALRGVDDNQASTVCERIRKSVVAHPWSAIAPGLSVTVSLGWSAAETGDTIDSLTARSDKRMYVDKGSSRQAARVGHSD